MKVKVISRSETAHTRDSKSDARKYHKNVDPKLHPFERAREVKRAVNAAKLDKIFAKPFLWSLEGHMDGVYSTAQSPTSLVAFLSGSCDGEIRVWDLAHKSCLWNVYGHRGFVRGLSVAGDGNSFVSCGDDRTIKKWQLGTASSITSSLMLSEDDTQPISSSSSGSTIEPIAMWTSKNALLSVDHHRTLDQFVTASTDGTVDIWHSTRSDPYQTFRWGADTVTCVKYNPSQVNVLASAGNDRSICLYDVRSSTPTRKIVMSMTSNALDWNPREPFNFTVANEDHNAYTFDMRKLDHALSVHKDHVSAVMDVKYSPSGKEFATASYDRTIRLWANTQGRSREVYHTKRMQRVFCVNFSGDGRYVLSGSDDTNIRVWKAEASRPLKKLLPRERTKLNYNDALKKRYAHVPEVRRITKHQHVPRVIVKARKRKREEEQRGRMKLERINAHSKDKKKPDAERTKQIVSNLE